MFRSEEIAGLDSTDSWQQLTPWKNNCVGREVKGSCLLEQPLASVGAFPDPRQMEHVSCPAALQQFLLQDLCANSDRPRQWGKSQRHRFPRGGLGTGVYAQAGESKMSGNVTSTCRGGGTEGPGGPAEDQLLHRIRVTPVKGFSGCSLAVLVPCTRLRLFLSRGLKDKGCLVR